MWIPLKNCDHSGFFLKIYKKEDGYIFHLTSFINLWNTHLEQAKFIYILKENNPLLEIDDSTHVKLYALDSFVKSFENGSTMSEIVFEERDGSKYLTLKTRICKDKVTIHFTLQFQPSDSETFYKEVTAPLLTNLQEATESEETLIDIIKKKDEEISEYKAEGAVLTLKHKRTKKFDESQHMNKFKPTENVFVNLDNLKSLCEAYKQTLKDLESTNVPHHTSLESSLETSQDCKADTSQINNQSVKTEDVGDTLLKTEKKPKIEMAESKPQETKPRKRKRHLNL